MTATAISREAHEQHPRAPGYAGHNADHLTRLNKVEGQMRGISRMVTADRTGSTSSPRSPQPAASCGKSPSASSTTT